MAETDEIEIARLGAQGDGIAGTASNPLYVPYALPGERVRIAHGDGRTRLVEVIRPSADRIAPVCRHFGICGGCVAQHMAADVYRRWKRDSVAQAFAHRGLDVTIGEVVGVAPASRRRAVLEARRDGAAVVLGFHAGGSHDIVDIAACPVLVPAIEAALPALRELAAAVLAPRDTCRMTITAAGNGLDLALDAAAADIPALARARLSQLAARAGIVRLTANGVLVVQTAVPTLELGGTTVRLPPATFIQACAEAETAIAGIIAGAVGKSKRVADLFCGIGTFTFRLAAKARVLALDSDQPALAALHEAARHAQGLKPIEVRTRDLLREPLSRGELDDLDAVVLDPPRTGAKAQAEMLAKSKVPIVAAVSCNPATLARDARILVDGGYVIEAVTPIDQFVWSQHVEAVAVLRRRRGR